MKITLTASDLYAAASWAARLAPSKPRIPVIAGVLIEAGERLVLSATDYDMFATVTVPASIGEPGRIVVSAALLAAVAKTLPGTAEVTLESGGKGLLFRCQRFKGSLPAMQDEDWPAFPDPGDPIGEVAGPVLSRCLDRVLPAVAAPGAEKVQLTGVLLDLLDGAALVASDSCRMAAVLLGWQPALGSDTASMIVPADLLKSVSDAVNGDTVTIRSDGSTVGLSTSRHRVIGRLHAGKFPGNWRALMDGPVQGDPRKGAAGSATIVTVEVESLRRSIEQVAAVSTSATKVPELVQIDVGPDEISVSLASADASGDTGVDLHSITGSAITVGVASRYMLDALHCLGSPLALLTFTDNPLCPLLLQPANENGELIADGYRHLLVPRSLTAPA